MTKNQKIAAGCGGLGCLGLIVLAIVCGVGYYFYYAQRSPIRVYSSNSNSNGNFNTNQNTNESTNSSASNSSSETSSSYSDDDKHKLFQAAGMTKDQELTVKVLKKIGLFKADGTPAADYPEFIKDHFSWALHNTDFVNSVNTPEKAKAYLDEHL